MKKIIIISYFFPPCSKAGSFRAVAMAEFLPRFGWQPIFIAPTNGYYGTVKRIDASLRSVVEQFPVYRVPLLYPFASGEDNGMVARLSRRIWETILIPDGKRLWNYYIKKSIAKIVNKHQPDVCFITGTPFSTFYLAPYLKEKFNLPVVLDYRDPWADNPLLGNGYIKSIVSRRYETSLLNNVDLITTASYYMIDYILSSVKNDVKYEKCFGFPYGYDGQYFKENILHKSCSPENSKIIGTFAGSVHGDINPELILDGIKLAIQNKPSLSQNLTINCYGTLFGFSGNPENLIAKYDLEKNVNIMPFLPYDKFLLALRQSSFLILPHGQSEIARVLYPTKFFDYLGVQRPILYLGQSGQVSETISECNCGVCVMGKPELISEAIINLTNGSKSQYNYDGYTTYKKLDRINIFREFTNRIIQLTN